MPGPSGSSDPIHPPDRGRPEGQGRTLQPDRAQPLRPPEGLRRSQGKIVRLSLCQLFYHEKNSLVLS